MQDQDDGENNSSVGEVSLSPDVPASYRDFQRGWGHQLTAKIGPLSIAGDSSDQSRETLQ